MSPELKIHYDFNKGRNNPAQVFDAMSIYINSYQQLLNLLSESMGLEEVPKLTLGDVKEGSIIGLFKTIANTPAAALLHSATKTADELQEQTDTENQVDQLAETVEQDMAQLLDLMVQPHIDRRKLIKVLQHCSKANSIIEDGETIIIEANSEEFGVRKSKINTDWRFTGDPHILFRDEKKSFQIQDKLLIKKPVNIGKDKWGVYSLNLKKGFYASMKHTAWLRDYQAGVIPAIGPNDVLEVSLRYDALIPGTRPEDWKIQDAEIMEVINVSHNSKEQGAFDFTK